MLGPRLQPFLDLELELGNEVKARHASPDGGSVRVEMARALHLEELRARLAWPEGLEAYESWGPHEPTEAGLRWGTSWDDLHTLAGPHPLFHRLRPLLEDLARALAEGRYADVAAHSRGSLGEDQVRRAAARLKRRAGRVVAPPPEAYQAAGCGDGRASVLVVPEDPGWRVFFDVWTERGRQAMAFELEVQEGREGGLDARLLQMTDTA